MGQVVIRVEGIYKSFGRDENRVEVLKGLHLSIEEGERVAITGASGVGKTTLLHILGALEHPTEGKVYYGDLDIFSLGDRDLTHFRNRNIGFVFQFHHLLPEFNALENVMMPALIYGMDKEEAEAKAEEVLIEVGLKGRLLHRPGELSGGEQQRVAVARALILKPKVLLADEPMGNLDVKTGEAVADLMVSLNMERGITMVVATHNVALARRMGRRLALVDGKALPLP